MEFIIYFIFGASKYWHELYRTQANRTINETREKTLRDLRPEMEGGKNTAMLRGLDRGSLPQKRYLVSYFLVFACNHFTALAHCYAMLSALNNCRRFAVLFVNFDSNCRFFYWSCWFSFWMLTHTWLAKTVERPSLFLLVYSRWDSSSDPRQPRTKSQCVNYRYSIIQEFYLSKKKIFTNFKRTIPWN